MRERPILFSGEMVRAILAGRKTQTRRIVKPHPDERIAWIQSDLNDIWRAGTAAGEVPEFGTWKCPYGKVGDRLWVRETFLDNALEGYPPVWFYRADDVAKPEDRDWRPSIFMPRSASRITLEVEKVRVQKLKEITAFDAIAEGVKDQGVYDWAVSDYRELWESINGRGSWDKNSRVWVIEFKMVAGGGNE